MNQLSQKFKLLAVVFTIIALSACSSSKVEEGTGASAETTADVNLDQPAPEASTDAVPNAEIKPSDSMASAPEAVPSADPALETPPAVPAEASMNTPPADPAVVAVAPITEVPPADAPVADTPITDAPITDAPAVAAAAPVSEAPAVAAVPVVDSAPAPESIPSASSDGTKYRVKRGDTLMKIAFEHYGDLYRWREIYEANRAQIKDFNHVPPGTQLSLMGAGMVTIEKNGESYLIKRGDTLGTISNDVYGTTRKWKKLWENNRQLIKDPNKIYAGFFLYYVPEGKLTREEVAPVLKKDDSAMNTNTQVGTAPRQPASNPVDAQAPAKN